MSENAKSRLQYSTNVKVLLYLVTILAIVWMFPSGESLDSEVTVGSVWIKEDLIASTTFEILKDPELYKREKLAAAENVHQIFEIDDDIPTTFIDSLKSYNKYISEIIDRDVFDNTRKFNDKTFLSDDAYQIFFDVRRFENSLSAEYSVKLTDVLKASVSALKSIYNRGMLSVTYDTVPEDSITVREGKFERLVDKRDYVDPDGALTSAREIIKSRLGGNTDIQDAAVEYLKHFMIPNVVFDEQLTDAARELAKEKVARNIGIVNENERIVAKHNRITPETKLKIDSYRAAIGEEKGIGSRVLQTGGKFLHVFLVSLILVLYIFLFRKKIYADNMKLLIMVIIVLLISFITFLVQQLTVTTPVYLLVFIPAASILVTVIFDSRLGFYTTVVVALIAGGLRGNDYVFTAMNIFAGALACYTVRDIKNRNQIFRSFLFILIGYLTGIFAFGLERYASIESLMIDSAFAASNALVSPVLAYGLIIFFEKIFKITTDLTLLELTDFNHPLLKEMARNAPGTFTHSMTIGSLVENAAEAIGANQLLARVGAYYHDIGKSLNPSNFVENQMSKGNVHEQMDPRDSARVIIKHVEEGIRLAKEKNLPQEIIDFIPMHHGTMAVYFFYKKSKELYGEDKVSIDDFRYPGPKPQSRETALVMLADACESAVRAMEEPQPEKIRNVVDNLIQIRLDDGQLDESPITFADIRKIKDAFYDILLSQHHKRIRYPKQDELENKKKPVNE